MELTEFQQRATAVAVVKMLSGTVPRMRIVRTTDIHGRLGRVLGLR